MARAVSYRTADAQAAADALTNGGLPVDAIETVGPDTVIDVEVTSNRSDCLSHIGIARELAALLNREFTDPPAASDKTAGPSGLAGLRIESPQLCPHYTARVIRNVKIGPARSGCSVGSPLSDYGPSTTSST